MIISLVFLLTTLQLSCSSYPAAAAWNITVCTNNFVLSDYFHLDFAGRSSQYAKDMKAKYWPDLEVKFVVPIAPSYRYIPINNKSSASTIVGQTSYSVTKSWISQHGNDFCDLFIGPSFLDAITSLSDFVLQPLWIDPRIDPHLLTLNDNNKIGSASTTTTTSSQANISVVNLAPSLIDNAHHLSEFFKMFGCRRVQILRSDSEIYEGVEQSFRTLFEDKVSNEWRVVASYSMPGNLDLGLRPRFIEYIRTMFLNSKPWSRVWAVIGDLSLFDAFEAMLQSLAHDIIVVFAGDICYGNSQKWKSVHGSFCIRMMVDSKTTDPYLQAFQSRNISLFNGTANNLLPFRYDYTTDLLPNKNYFDYYSALTIDAMSYGLALLQKYLKEASSAGDGVGGSGNADGVPTSVLPPAGRRQISNKMTSLSIQGLTGELSLSSDGHRNRFLAEIHHSNIYDEIQLLGNMSSTSSISWNREPQVLTLLNQHFFFPFLRAADMPQYRTIEGPDLAIPTDEITTEAPLKTPPPLENQMAEWIYPATAVVGALLLSIMLFFVIRYYRFLTRELVVRHAPKDHNEPITIMFTDIEASTALWAEHPREMAAALHLHNSVIRKCISKYKGYEVKTIGDSFMVAFKSANDAMLCALSIQRDLYHSDWSRLRKGVDASAAINDFYDLRDKQKKNVSADEPKTEKEENKMSSATLPTFGLPILAPQDKINKDNLSTTKEEESKVPKARPSSMITDNTKRNVLLFTRNKNLPPRQTSRQPRIKVTIPLQNGLRVRIGLSHGLVSIRRTVVGKDGATRVLTDDEVRNLLIKEENKSRAHGAFGTLCRGVAQMPTAGVVTFDYYGKVVNAAARVEAMGHGGQILASKAFIEAVHKESIADRKMKGMTKEQDFIPKAFITKGNTVNTSSSSGGKLPSFGEGPTNSKISNANNIPTERESAKPMRRSGSLCTVSDPEMELTATSSVNKNTIFNVRRASFSAPSTPTSNRHPNLQFVAGHRAFNTATDHSKNQPPASARQTTNSQVEHVEVLKKPMQHAHVQSVLTKTKYKGPPIGLINLGKVELEGLGEITDIFQITTSEFVEREFPSLRLHEVRKDTNAVQGVSKFQKEYTFHDELSAVTSQVSNNALQSRPVSVTSVHKNRFAATGVFRIRPDLESHGNVTDKLSTVSSITTTVDTVAPPNNPRQVAHILHHIAARRHQREPEVRMGYYMTEALLSVLQPSETRVVLKLLLKRWRVDPKKDGSGLIVSGPQHEVQNILQRALLASKVAPAAMVRLYRSLNMAVGVGEPLNI